MTPTAKDFEKLLVGNGFYFSTAQIRSLILPILNVFVLYLGLSDVKWNCQVIVGVLITRADITCGYSLVEQKL